MVEENDAAQEEQPPSLLGPEEFIFPNGATYSGTYLDLEGPTYHGEGEYVCGFEMYTGKWENGVLVNGKYTAKGHCYEGAFNDQFQFHGFGIYQSPDGRTYRGEWKNGQVHGKGQFENFQRVQNAITEKRIVEHRKLLAKRSHGAWKEIENPLRGGIGKDIFEGISQENVFDSSNTAQATLAAEQEKPEEKEAPED